MLCATPGPPHQYLDLTRKKRCRTAYLQGSDAWERMDERFMQAAAGVLEACLEGMVQPLRGIAAQSHSRLHRQRVGSTAELVMVCEPCDLCGVPGSKVAGPA